MLEFRLGARWKGRPEWIEGLRRLATAPSTARFRPREITEVVAVIVDGRDVSRGRLDGRLLDIITLLAAAGDLLRSEKHFTLVVGHFEISAVVEGPRCTLSMRNRTEEVLSGMLALPPDGFADAVQRLIAGFFSELAGIDPGLPRQRWALAAAAGHGIIRARKHRPVIARAPMADVDLVVRASPAAVAIIDQEGRERWSLAGRPDSVLPSMAAAIRDAHGCGLRFDLSTARVTAGRSRPIPIETFANALERLASQLGIAIARPRSSRPEHLPVTAVQAERALRGPRTGLGGLEGLRRLHFRNAWRAQLPEGRLSLWRAGSAVALCHARRVELRSADGSLRWSAALHDAHRVIGADEFVASDGPRHLVVVAVADGKRLARIASPLDGRVRSALTLEASTRLLADHEQATAVDLVSGKVRWAFDAPGSRGIHVARIDGGVILAGTQGPVVAVDHAGRRAWRVNPSVEAIDWIGIDPTHRRAVVVGRDHDGAGTIAAFSLMHGHIAWRRRLAGAGAFGPIIEGDRLVVGHGSSRNPALSCVSLDDGRLLWDVSIPGEGRAVPMISRDGLFLARNGGGLARFTRGGKLRSWTQSHEGERETAPSKPRPVVLAAGLVFSVASALHVFDARTVRRLAMLEPTELAPESMLVMDGPLVVTAGRDGLVETWRASGHLRVA